MFKLSVNLLVLMLVVFLLGCSQAPSSVAPVSSVDGPTIVEGVTRTSQWRSDWSYDFGKDCTFPFIAGQHIQVGKIVVRNDLEHVYVRYELEDSWFLIETHLHVARTVEEIPQVNGNPVPGLFDYQTQHDPPVQVFEYIIDICSISDGNWNPGDEFVVAAHAEVWNMDVWDPENGFWEETAWGGDNDFPGDNWGKYGICDLKCELDNCLVLIPESPVTASFDVLNKCLFYTATKCWGFWEKVTLSNVPPGYYSVSNVPKSGWCLDQNSIISGDNQPKQYPVTLHSSQGSYLPGKAATCDWERINYILNHKQPGASKCDIQQAIWNFARPINCEIESPIAWEMIFDALAHGAGYHPGGNWGEVEAVILDAGLDPDGIPYQLTIIEVGCVPVSKPCGGFCAQNVVMSSHL